MPAALDLNPSLAALQETLSRKKTLRRTSQHRHAPFQAFSSHLPALSKVSDPVLWARVFIQLGSAIKNNPGGGGGGKYLESQHFESFLVNKTSLKVRGDL